MDQNNLFRIFKALGDETRLEIVSMLSLEKKCACQLQEKFDITQPTLSHHMKILVESTLLIQTKIGKWMYYQINPDILSEVISFLDRIKLSKADYSSCEANCEK